MAELKRYQARTLEVIDRFFRDVRFDGLDAAWLRTVAPAVVDGVFLRPKYQKSSFGEIPAVCVRIPTGGGKTFLAANALGTIGRALLETEVPVVLWLVPSEAIHTQTKNSLADPRHICGQALAAAFGDRYKVLDLADLSSIGPQDVGGTALVIVATIQSFNVRERSQRNVYSFHEVLAPHFQGIPDGLGDGLQRVTEDDVAAQPFLTDQDLGRVKASPANWLMMQRPIVVVDEAHNNRTEQAFRTLKDLRPSAVLELTATPAKGSNVLHHVSAFELRQEEMIKLPIVLHEHLTNWRAAVKDAVLTRTKLEQLALKEGDYIRPVLLFQAENKSGTVTVETLVDHLTAPVPDGQAIPREQIAIATGSQKELDGIKILDRDCPIRFVVTVEALKEGWDCPFAYVLCGLQNIRSAKDVEQLLGRILRMPYTRARSNGALSKAYAHVVATATSEAAVSLQERLVENMGFDPYDAVQAIEPAQASFEPTEGGAAISPPKTFPPSILPLPAKPAMPTPPGLAGKVDFRPTSTGATAIVRPDGPMIDDAMQEFLLTACSSDEEREELHLVFASENARRMAPLAPAARGEKFPALPQLVLNLEGEFERAEPETFLEVVGFDLLTEPITLEGFGRTEEGNVWTIDLNGAKRIVRERTEILPIDLNSARTPMTEEALLVWLEPRCRVHRADAPMLRRWLSLTIRHLLVDRKFTIAELDRHRETLLRSLIDEVARRQQRAKTEGFQLALEELRIDARANGAMENWFVFGGPETYDARPPVYDGSSPMKKHFYAAIDRLQEKNASGSLREETGCARIIDLHPLVRYWIRNMDSVPDRAFWLPTAQGKFYPDFVVLLDDGRLLIVEYKGEDRFNGDKAVEERAVGQAWETQWAGKGLFLMARAKDPLGRDVRQQIDAKIAGGLQAAGD